MAYASALLNLSFPLYPISILSLPHHPHEAFSHWLQVHYSPDGPDISFLLYHECLHSIAFMHAKILSLPCHKFIDPASPVNDDGTISVQFLPHWCKQLLLPLFLWLLHIYIKPQLHPTDNDNPLTTSCLQTLLKFLVFPWNKLVIISTSYNLLHCLNSFAIGNWQINH